MVRIWEVRSGQALMGQNTMSLASVFTNSLPSWEWSWGHSSPTRFGQYQFQTAAHLQMLLSLGFDGEWGVGGVRFPERQAKSFMCYVRVEIPYGFWLTQSKIIFSKKLDLLYPACFKYKPLLWLLAEGKYFKRSPLERENVIQVRGLSCVSK